MKIISLQNENDNQNKKIASLQKENDNQNKKIVSLQNENDKIKLNNNNLNKKIMSMIKYHESDMNLLKNEISKLKNKCRIMLQREKENYENLNEKFNSILITRNTLEKKED
jgi:chromosome segregation ATPase